MVRSSPPDSFFACRELVADLYLLLGLTYTVKGVYFHWANSAAAPAIKDWNVAALQIDPTKRHMDRALVAQFWRALDGFRPAGPVPQGR